MNATPAYQASVGNVGNIDVSPFPAPANTSTLTIAVTGATTAASAPLGGAVAVTMCGNFLTDGTTPITPAMMAANTTRSYCDGANQTAKIGFAVAVAGAFNTTYTLRPSGIGDAAVQCLPGGQIACLVAFGDVATSGKNFAGGVPVFGGGGSGTTTTSGVTTTTSGVTTTTSGVTTTTSLTSGGPKVTVDPSSDLVDGQVVKVTVTGLAALEGQALAITECGNATSAGAALPVPPSTSDCFGAEGIGSGQLLLVPVSGGTATADYPVALAGIGTNAATCSAAVSTPCAIAVADVATQGEALTLQAPITPKAGAKANGGTGSGTGTGAGGSTSTTGAPEVKGTVQVQPASGTLPYTGTGASTWLLVAMGLALLDLGWLAASATRPPRRRS